MSNVNAAMTNREERVFNRLTRFQRDRQEVYKRAADSTNERSFEKAVTLNCEQSARWIKQLNGGGTENIVRPSLIGRLLLLMMDIKWIAGIRSRNAILTFCLLVEFYVIAMYGRINKRYLSMDGLRLLNWQLNLMKETRVKMLELRSQARKGQPFAVHYKLT
jgi:hypothetical protein